MIYLRKMKEYQLKLQNLEKKNIKLDKKIKENEKMIKESKRICKENIKKLVENEKIIKENEKRKKVILALLNNAKNGRPYYDNERALNLLKYNYNNNNENYKKLLEEVELKEPFKNGEEKKCIICLENFSIGDKISYLPCFHFFHSSCIYNWLRIKNKCPFCNSVINF